VERSVARIKLSGETAPEKCSRSVMAIVYGSSPLEQPALQILKFSFELFEEKHRARKSKC